MYKPFKPSQPSLVSAIFSELSEQCPNSAADVALMNKVIEAANMICAECERERVYADKPMTPTEWLESDDVGASSKYMLCVLAEIGFPAHAGPTPRDAADLGRCIRMLKSCGLEGQVKKIAEASSEWKRIAENWPALVTWYDENQSHRIYDFLSNNE